MRTFIPTVGTWRAYYIASPQLILIRDETFKLSESRKRKAKETAWKKKFRDGVNFCRTN